MQFLRHTALGLAGASGCKTGGNKCGGGGGCRDLRHETGSHGGFALSGREGSCCPCKGGRWDALKGGSKGSRCKDCSCGWHTMILALV